MCGTLLNLSGVCEVLKILKHTKDVGKIRHDTITSSNATGRHPIKRFRSGLIFTSGFSLLFAFNEGDTVSIVSWCFCGLGIAFSAVFPGGKSCPSKIMNLVHIICIKSGFIAAVISVFLDGNLGAIVFILLAVVSSSAFLILNSTGFADDKTNLRVASEYSIELISGLLVTLSFSQLNMETSMKGNIPSMQFACGFMICVLGIYETIMSLFLHETEGNHYNDFLSHLSDGHKPLKRLRSGLLLTSGLSLPLMFLNDDSLSLLIGSLTGFSIALMTIFPRGDFYSSGWMRPIKNWSLAVFFPSSHFVVLIGKKREALILHDVGLLFILLSMLLRVANFKRKVNKSTRSLMQVLDNSAVLLFSSSYFVL